MLFKFWFVSLCVLKKTVACVLARKDNNSQKKTSKMENSLDNVNIFGACFLAKKAKFRTGQVGEQASFEFGNPPTGGSGWVQG